MSDIIGDSLNIEVARLLGVLRVSHLDDKVYYDGEDYVNDLNAMHKAEGTLESYHLAWMAMRMVGVSDYVEMSAVRMAEVFHATARQRAEAFVAVMEGK